MERVQALLLLVRTQMRSPEIRKGRRQLIESLSVTYSGRKTVKLSNRLALDRATGIRDGSQISSFVD